MDLHDAGTYRLSRLKRPSTLEHFPRMIEQADVREDRTEAVVGVRKIVLQRNCALEVGYSFQVLEIPGRSPEHEGTRDIGLRQVGVQVKSATGMKLGLFKPGTGRIVFEMPGGARKRQSGVGKRKSWVAGYSICKKRTRLIHLGRVAGSRDSVFSHELCIG